MKKLILIAQSKGGAGKSILTYLLAEKYTEAVIFDMDDATKTSSMQLAYRQPIQITFLDKDNTIDRGRFDAFLERLSTRKSSHFLADMGASISEQLPFYLEEVIDFLPRLLARLGIEMELYTVIGGANMFVQTFSYLESLYRACDNKLTIKVFRNEYYDFLPEQDKLLEEFITQTGLEVHSFNITRSKISSRRDQIREVLNKGKGISDETCIANEYFRLAINDLTV